MVFDTFSCKSYVILPRNFAEYWPRRDRPTPEREAEFIDFLSRKRYGAAWQPERGVVERSGQKRLKPTTAPIDDFLLADPDIRFFNNINAGHADGDMLVCLCPLSFRNWIHALAHAVGHRRTVRGRVRSLQRHSAAVKRQSAALARQSGSVAKPE